MRALSAPGCPGVAASSPTLLFGAGKDRRPPQQLQVRNRKMTNRQSALANAALLWSAAGLRQSFRHQAVTRQNRKPRANAVWVAGPDRICFAGEARTVAVLSFPKFFLGGVPGQSSSHPSSHPRVSSSGMKGRIKPAAHAVVRLGLQNAEP
jgi:hypothetical protein